MADEDLLLIVNEIRKKCADIQEGGDGGVGRPSGYQSKKEAVVDEPPFGQPEAYQLSQRGHYPMAG